MVILSTAVVSKTGRILVARQFVEMTKVKAESLISAFIKIVEATPQEDHTVLDTDTVRYIYQPLDLLYVVLVTTRDSNVIEDIETLRMLHQLMQDNTTETKVSDNAFDLIFAFDELISMGYREAVTLSQINTFVEMDSHEEKVAAVLQKAKEDDEYERRKKIAEKLAKQRAQEKAIAKQEAELTSKHAAALTALASTKVVEERTGAQVVVDRNDEVAPRKGMQLGTKKVAAAEFTNALQRP
eukprot:GHVO01049764.1.p1 GENE.GHVO01049764.1~~GHVO01049764.1.p1  ORF type:complete len:241 (+),score=36.20 GHVO01049764.1:32-754(+)